MTRTDTRKNRAGENELRDNWIPYKKILNASRFLFALMALCLLCIPALAVQPQWTFPLSPNTTHEGNLNKITIDPITDHSTDDSFVVHGTANMPPGEKILVDILPALEEYPPGGLRGGWEGMSETAIVQPGKNSPGEWSCPVRTAGWVPFTYRVRVTPVNQEYGEPVSTQFNLTERQSPTQTAPAQNTTASPVLLQNFSIATTAATGNPPQEVPTTHPAPLLPTVSIAAAGLGVLTSRRDRNE